MKTALFVDCLIRHNESRTKLLVEEFFANLSSEYKIVHLKLDELELKPLCNEFFQRRQELLDHNKRNHPRFKYAHQIAEADLVVMAAPFWDLSIPALLKIYIENCSVDGITFASDETGLHGLCQGRLVYLTTRGGNYENSSWAQDIPYLKAIQEFFGFKDFQFVAADKMDISEEVRNKSLKQARQKVKKLAGKY